MGLNELNWKGLWSPSGLGWGIALMIFSIWLMVDVPGKRAFPNSISPRIQPRLHMSTPLVYLWTWCTPFTGEFFFSKVQSWHELRCRLSNCSNNILIADAHYSWYLVDPSRISGALYHRVATYSVSAGFPLSSWIWLSDLAKPKSHSLTTQSVSNSTLDGCEKHRGRSLLTEIICLILPLLSKGSEKRWRNRYLTEWLYHCNMVWVKCINKYLAYLLVPVNNISWMQVFDGF